jgi:hypothetical protein
MKSHAKEIIDMADRFGVCGLKLEVEACLVKTTTFFVVVVVIITNMQSLASLHRSPKKTAAKFVLMNQY